ncbi:MAG: YebC/PmpR family DNA-binding transcriptional regulator [Armatimonadetes bacterium]|nr:YebC/PmpR family DNA-binding transcriptional regulator [Armatimonadota bacterium]MDW8154133.1 YebC/PmpR family DNA-binding transcriptional regulator [Armatimonadota bacterium]
MAGHSRWHNIRIKKEKMDRVRGKLFSKLTREIIVAAREGGSNPDANPRLRSAIERAREAGMPNENIQRAITRGAGAGGGEHYEEVTYEGYGPGGVAILVRAATDNRNRTAAEIRSVFHRLGGSMAEAGAVAWMFNRKGVIQVDRGRISEDDLLLVALEAGAEDVRPDDGVYEVITAPEDLNRVREALAQAGIEIGRVEITLLPKSTVPLDGPEAERVLRLLEALEELDDVQQVYANFDIPEEILQRVS